MTKNTIQAMVSEIKRNSEQFPKHESIKYAEIADMYQYINKINRATQELNKVEVSERDIEEIQQQVADIEFNIDKIAMQITNDKIVKDAIIAKSPDYQKLGYTGKENREEIASLKRDVLDRYFTNKHFSKDSIDVNSLLGDKREANELTQILNTKELSSEEAKKILEERGDIENRTFLMQDVLNNVDKNNPIYLNNAKTLMSKYISTAWDNTRDSIMTIKELNPINLNKARIINAEREKISDILETVITAKMDYEAVFGKLSLWASTIFNHYKELCNTIDDVCIMQGKLLFPDIAEKIEKMEEEHLKNGGQINDNEYHDKIAEIVTTGFNEKELEEYEQCK